MTYFICSDASPTEDMYDRIMGSAPNLSRTIDHGLGAFDHSGISVLDTPHKLINLICVVVVVDAIILIF